MNLYGSLRRLISIVFRKSGFLVTFEPGTTSSATTFQLPTADGGSKTLVDTASSQTLSGKSMDGDDNTFSDISISSLKTVVGDANEAIVRDGSGAVVSAKIVDANIDAAAAIDASKIADGSVSNAEFQFINTLTSNAQTQINTKVTGPASATDEAITRYDGTTGKLVQDSSVTISDAGVMSGATQFNVDNLRLDGNTLSSTSGNVVVSPTASVDITAGTGSATLATTANSQPVNITTGGSSANISLDAAGATSSVRLAASTAVELRNNTPLRLHDADSSAYIGHKSAAVVSSSITYQWPEAPASNGYVLAAQTDGTMSWVSNASTSSSKTDWTDQTATVTFTNATDRVNYTAHGLENGQTLYFTNSGGALPSGITSGFIYYVINKTANDFQISTSYGGSAVDFTTDGTGTNTANVTSKAVTHGLGTQDLMIQVFDKDDGFQVEFDEVIRISTTHVIINGTELPGGTGFRILIAAV